MSRSFSDWRAQSARQTVPVSDIYVPGSDESIPVLASRDSFPLSYTQERIWFVNQLDPRKPIYVCPHPVRLRGALKLAALEAALSEIVLRHELLRTRFMAQGQNLRQYVMPVRPRSIPVVDLQHLQADDAWCLASDLAQRDTLLPFDLEHDESLLRVALIRLASDDHVLLFTLHHLIGDDWSMTVLIEEMAGIYARHAAGRPDREPPPPLQYGDFAQWQRNIADSRGFERRRRYWHDKLRDLPVLNLATDRNRGAVQSHAGHKVFAQLPPDVLDGLKAVCAQVGSTPFVIVLALFKLIFQRYSNQDDIAIGVPVAGRGRPELQRLVGPILNMLVMRSKIDANARFADFLADVRNTVVDAFEHQDVPFEKLVEDLQPARDLSHAPLCQVVIAYHYDSLPRSSFADLSGEPIALSRAPVVFDLDITATEHENTLWLSVTYDTQLFDESTVRQMMAEYSLAAAAVAADPEITLTQLRAECAAASGPALARWNDSETVEVPRRDLGSLFLDAAAESPDAIALIGASGRVSFAGLRRRALRIADCLRVAGIGPESVVGSAVERTCESVATMLGILIAGGAYAYIDAEYPDERIRELLELTGIRIVLATAAKAPRFAPFGIQVVVVDEGQDARAKTSTPPTVHLHPDSSACVVFTSGSVGKPKAVVSPHRAILNRLQWMWRTQEYRGGEIMAHRVSLNFVDCICEALGPLLQGRPLVIVDETTGRDVAGLLRLLAQEQVGRLVLIPSLLATLLKLDPELGATLPALRHWVCSGEPLGADVMRRFRESVPGATLYNFYGSSEVAADVTAADVTDADVTDADVTAITTTHGGAPLGHPIDNTRMALVDALGFPVPPIVAGEIVIAGEGLARGYRHAPAATADRFRPSSLGGPPGQRIYMTGDMARLSPAAECSFVGRRDQQVKVHGRRIELGEIEGALLAHPDVRQAAVLTASDGQRLVGFYASDTGVSEEILSAYLKARLPQFMVPSQLVRMQDMPALATGKLDRKALAALHLLHPHDTADAAPSTVLERQLADIWQRVLNVPRPGVHADFFSLGGHSMAALQMIFLIDKELRRKLDIAALFQNPTVASLANHIGTLTADAADGPARIEAVPDLAGRERPFPLTDLQQAYWVGRTDAFRQGQVSIHAYFEVEAEQLDLTRFTRVWNTLVRRHDMLRAVVTEDGQQKILANVPDYRIELADLRAQGEDEVQRRLAAMREELSHQVLPLERWPSFDVRATVRSGDRVRLHVSIDTFFIDGWSQRLLFGELVALYDDPGAVLDPPRLELSFRDWFLAAQTLAATPEYERSISAWKERVKKLPPAPELPVVRQREGEPARVRNLNAQLDASIALRLRERAHGIGRSIVDVALAGYVRIISAWSANANFTLNIPTFSRMQLHAETNRVVGPFSSFTIGEFDGSAAENFGDLLSQAHDQLRFGAEHQLVSGIELMRELRRTHGFSYYLPVVFTSLIFDADAAAVDFVSKPSALRSIYACGQTPQIWLDSRVDLLTGGVLSLGWDVPEGVFPEGLVDDMFNAYVGYLRAMADKDWDAGDSLEIPFQQTRIETLVVANGLLHTDFELRALQTPEAEALRCGEVVLRYGELHALSHRLSMQLRAAGAGRNGLVAVVMEKGWEQVAAVLAVVMSGAAYLPLDARWPAERLEQLLKESETSVVLTQSRVLREWRVPAGLRTLCVDEERGRADVDGQGLPPVESAQPDDLAYVIYTSGSTGRPKGVMITHRAALNTVRDVNERFGVTPADRVLGLSSMSFDLSVYDVFGTLSAGGCLVLPTAAEERDPSQWWELIAEHGVTIWNSVPALLELLVDYGRRVGSRGEGAGLASLRLALLSGDWIGLTLPDAIRSLARDCAVVSLGGATEAAIWSVLYAIDAMDADWTSIPYGRPMKNQRLYVLNEAWQLCPVWARGSLYIAGEGLASGYWRDEARTAASFVLHPHTGERLYRTGDLARYRPDGCLELLGREDLQIKLHGHRIEPGEIEATMLQHPWVSQAAVVAQRTARGDQQLAAFVVLATRPAADAVPDPPTGDYLKKLEIRTSQPNVRKDPAVARASAVALVRAEEDIGVFLKRRSRRRFLQTSMPMQGLGLMLSGIAQARHPLLMFPKYQYGSAGNLYPIQVYLYAKSDRIPGLAQGFYYYNPRNHDLRALQGTTALLSGDIGEQNAALFDDCAFAVFLVASMAAMDELYGEVGARYAAIEAGLVTQLLETRAPDHGIGLCQVGGVSFPGMRECLAVDDRHLLLHTLLGGPVDPAEDTVEGAIADAKAFGPTRPDAGNATASTGETFEAIKGMLKAKLPVALIPAVFIEMDTLPLNDNGKVDRGALRDLQPVAHGARAPATAVAAPAPSATILAELCAQVLGRGRVDVHENFLESGGNSMLAIKLISRVQNLFGLAVPLADFFEDATPAGLAALIEKLRQDTDHAAEVWQPVAPDLANRYEPFPLSAVQQAYWVGRRDSIHLGSVSTHAYMEVDIVDLDVARFERAMRLLIARHDMLRAVFSADGYQRILKEVPAYEVGYRDLRGLVAGEAESGIVEARAMMSHQVLPADRWPLFEIFVQRLPECFRLHLSIDLLLADAYSLQLLHRDLLGFYDRGEEYAPRTVDFSFRDYILAARRLRESTRYARAKAYWMERLPQLPLPPELPRRARAGNGAHKFFRLSAQFERSRWEVLRQKAARSELSPSSLLCAAFGRILALWTGTSRFTLGMTTFGRLGLHPDIDEIVGDFTTMIPLVVDVGAPRFETAAQTVQRQLWRDMDNALFDGIEVQRERNRLQRHIGAAAFPVVFTSTIGVGAAEPAADAKPALTGSITHSISQTSQVLLDHQVTEVGGALSYTWDYDGELLPQDLMNAMFAAYGHLLNELSSGEGAWSV